MFLNFFYELKNSGIPVSVMEYPGFLNARGRRQPTHRRFLLPFARLAREGRAASR
jgi:hypothetical protein